MPRFGIVSGAGASRRRSPVSRPVIVTDSTRAEGRALLQSVGPGGEMVPFIRFGWLSVLAMASAALLGMRLVALIPGPSRKAAAKRSSRSRRKR